MVMNRLKAHKLIVIDLCSGNTKFFRICKDKCKKVLNGSGNVKTDNFIFQVVTVNSLENDVVILPTKTRPKKIVLVGSDGQKYVQQTMFWMGYCFEKMFG